MRRAFGSGSTSSRGGSFPSASPLSTSAPDSDRLGSVYASSPHEKDYHNGSHPHGGILRSSSTLHNSSNVASPHAKYGTRSRSALGLSSRPQSRSSAGSRHPPNHHGHARSSDTASPSPSSSSSSSQSHSYSGYNMENEMLLSSTFDFTPKLRQTLIDIGDHAVDDAYNLCHGYGTLRWQPTKTREGVSIYRAKGVELSDEPRIDASVRGKCNVSASFDEMMDTMITETTHDFVAHESSVNPAEFLDGQVLCTLVPRTRGDRFVCVKWHSIKSLAPSVAKNRDYLYVEVVDKFTDRDGHKVGYRLSKSVELPALQAFDHPALFVRGKTLTLHTFSEVSPGNLELYTMMINDLGERLPAWLVHKIVDTAAMRSACLRDYINQKRMDLLVLARPTEMVPLHKRVCCVVCTRSFSIVRKKYNCVVCGDVMCNPCSVHQFVAPPNGTINDFVGKKKARICVRCSSKAQRRELPRRASSGRASLTSAASTSRMSEMDHRRSSGSTIASSSSHHHQLQQQRQQQEQLASRYAEQHNRRSNSGSSLGSSSSFLHHSGSLERDENGQTNSNENGAPAAATTSNRTTIPHMFQFRPAKQNGSTLSAGRSSIRSSGMSTSQSSSSPEDDMVLTQTDFTGSGEGDNDYDDDDDDDDDDQEHMMPGDEMYELGASGVVEVSSWRGGGGRGPSDDDMDFDNLLDESALDRGKGNETTVDLGVGKYRNSYAPGVDHARDESDEELTDADDDETLVAPSTDSGGSRVSAVLTSPSAMASMPIEDGHEDSSDDEELTIEEVSPQNSFRSSIQRPPSSSTPRQSIVSMSSATEEMTIVKPVVVKNFRKRPAPGSSSKALKVDTSGSAQAPASSPPPRPQTPPLPSPRVNPLVESIVTRSRRATLPEEPLDEVEIDDAIQLADLQVHLDRMTMISESLKNLQQQPVVESPAKKLRASLASAVAMEAQFATISHIEMRAQEEAALAAGFAQAIQDEAERQAESKDNGKDSGHGAEIDDDFGDESLLELSSSSGDVHLWREDGSFSGFLADSSFSKLSASAAADGSVVAVVPGWVTVHSKTTGKLYYYNETCGTTSWTIPTPDTSRRSASYMVL